VTIQPWNVKCVPSPEYSGSAGYSIDWHGRDQDKNLGCLQPMPAFHHFCLALVSHSTFPSNVAYEPKSIKHKLSTASSNKQHKLPTPSQKVLWTFGNKLWTGLFPRKIQERVGKVVICPLEPGEIVCLVMSHADVDIASSGKTTIQNHNVISKKKTVLPSGTYSPGALFWRVHLNKL
jgi:hypothetical protein